MIGTKAVERRSRIDSEAVKALLIINGGMAAGLTAMLPKIIESSNIPVMFGRSMIAGICLAALGLVCVVVHSRLRRKCSLEYSKRIDKRKPPYKLRFLVRLQTVAGESRVCTNSIIFFWSSLVCFCLGAAIVAFGAWTITTGDNGQANATIPKTAAIADSQRSPKAVEGPGIPRTLSTSQVPDPAGVASSAHSSEEKDSQHQETQYLSLLGHEIKITDGALCLATFLLAFATFRLVRRADHNAEKQLRAYVSVAPKIVVSVDPFTVEFEMRNHGQTPAHDDRLEYSGIVIWDHPLPGGWQFPEKAPLYASHRVLYHDSPGTFRLSRTHENPFTSTEVAEVTNVDGDKRIYLYGSRKYCDAFGREHVTRFCRSIRPNDVLAAALNGLQFDKSGFQFEFSEQHNCAT